MRTTVIGVLLGARFLLELGLIAAAGWLGWQAGSGGLPGAVLAVLAAAATATLWGLLLSPKARLAAPLALRLLVEAILFAAAGVGLWLSGQAAWAVGLAVGEAVVLASLLALGVRPGPTSE